MKLPALLQKRPRRRCFPVNVVKFLRTPFLKNSSGQLLLTLQVHKVDKNMSRNCNKDIKVKSTEAILVTLYRLQKWFCMVRKLWKLPFRTLIKISEISRKVTVAEFRYSQTIFLQFVVTLLMILKLMIFWNFMWKLHMQSPFEQLRWSFFVENLLIHYSSKKIWGGFHHWGYIRESWTTLPPNCFHLHETQKQQDEILDSPWVLISLSNNRDENKLNLLGR